MSSPTVHVVVGYDFSRTGHAALTRAVTLAARSHGHALHVVCALEEDEPLPSIPAPDGVDHGYAARVQAALAVAVQEELSRQGVAGGIELHIVARIARPADLLLSTAREVGAELIIVGHHDIAGLERLLVGRSLGARLIRDATCSVEIARAPQRYRYEDEHGVLA